VAETTNISQMAELLSKELFEEFLWEQSGPMNINWPCIKEEHEAKTHPSDVVFSYLEPYADIRTYLNCDLKSYAKGTINKGSVRTAIESLGNAIQCAEISEDWQKLYKVHDENFDIHGLLFIFNHDGEYDKEFAEILRQATAETRSLPKGKRIYVLGPFDICYLSSVVNDIKRLRGDGKLLATTKHRFYYPDLINRKVVRSGLGYAATLEMLTSPIQVIKYDSPKGGTGLLIYYRESGRTIDEFLYLIDYLFHYQQLQENISIDICLPFPDKNASSLLESAKKEYLVKANEDEALSQRMEIIHYRPVINVVKEFHPYEIGMRYEK